MAEAEITDSYDTLCLLDMLELSKKDVENGREDVRRLLLRIAELDGCAQTDRPQNDQRNK